MVFVKNDKLIRLAIKSIIRGGVIVVLGECFDIEESVIEIIESIFGDISPNYEEFIEYGLMPLEWCVVNQPARILSDHLEKAWEKAWEKAIWSEEPPKNPIENQIWCNVKTKTAYVWYNKKWSELRFA